MPVEEIVQFGASWLDRNYTDWYNEIDLDRLNVADMRHCVFGQLFPSVIVSYHSVRAVNISGLDQQEMIDYGFSFSDKNLIPNYQACWIEEIFLRRA